MSSLWMGRSAALREGQAMRWRREKKPALEPVWALSVCSVAWMEDREEIIDGIRVEFLKPGWSWTVLREDLPYGGGRIVASDIAETQEEALRIGLEEVKRSMTVHPADPSLLDG